MIACPTAHCSVTTASNPPEVPGFAVGVYAWLMPGVVSLVDGAAGELVYGLWDRLTRELGIAAAPPGAIPHVTYHVAEGYGEAAVSVMDSLATRFAPFEVGVTGLGLFSGRPPVLYLAVVRSRPLAALQEAAYQALTPICAGTGEYWASDRWAPHITLAMEGLTPELVTHAMAFLADMDLAAQVRINNLALLDERTGTHELIARTPLTGVEVEGK